jgi:hypothetical protein
VFVLVYVGFYSNGQSWLNVQPKKIVLKILKFLMPLDNLSFRNKKARMPTLKCEHFGSHTWMLTYVQFCVW